MSKELLWEIKAAVAARTQEQGVSEEERARRQELAEGLFELVHNNDFLRLVLGSDPLARTRVEWFLAVGRRDDVSEAVAREELAIKVLRLPGSLGNHGEIVVKRHFPNVSFLFDGRSAIAEGGEGEVRERLNKAFAGECDEIEVRVEDLNYSATIEREIRTPEELIKTHGSRLGGVMKNLLEFIERR